MSDTTTMRVDRSVHERLVRLGRASGRQLIDVVRDATEALERAEFADTVRRELDTLRGDPVAWAAYVGEAELAVGDGLT